MFVSSSLALSLVSTFSDDLPGVRTKFDDWEVYVSQSEMEPIPLVLISTDALLDKVSPDGEPIKRRFGMRIFGKSYYQFDFPNFGGKNYWPYCDYEFTTFAVDGRKAEYFPMATGGGSCGHVVNGDWIMQFQRGQNLRFRIDYNTGSASLKGFSRAWAFATSKAR